MLISWNCSRSQDIFSACLDNASRSYFRIESPVEKSFKTKLLSKKLHRNWRNGRISGRLKAAWANTGALRSVHVCGDLCYGGVHDQPVASAPAWAAGNKTQTTASVWKYAKLYSMQEAGVGGFSPPHYFPKHRRPPFVVRQSVTMKIFPPYEDNTCFLKKLYPLNIHYPYPIDIFSHVNWYPLKCWRIKIGTKRRPLCSEVILHRSGPLPSSTGRSRSWRSFYSLVGQCTYIT